MKTNVDELKTGLHIEFPKNLLDYAAFGRSVTGNFPINHAGQLTDYNLWNISLSVEQMLEWTSCKSKIKGNIVNWETALWEETNLIQREGTYEEICVSQKIGYIDLKLMLKFQDASLLCSGLRGEIPLLENKIEEDKLVQTLGENRQSMITMIYVENSR